jgi:hypothetical protein
MIVHTKTYGKLQVKARHKESGARKQRKNLLPSTPITKSDNLTGKTYPTSARWIKPREFIHPDSLKIKTASEIPR